MFLDNCDTMTLVYLRVIGLSGLLGCAIVVGEISVVPLLLQDGSPSPISLFVELHDTQQSSKLAWQRKVRFVNPADTQTNHYHHVEHNQGDL